MSVIIFSANVGVRSPLLQQQHQQYDEQLRDIAASLTRPRSRRALPPTLERPTRLPPPDRLPVILVDKFVISHNTPKVNTLSFIF